MANKKIFKLFLFIDLRYAAALAVFEPGEQAAPLGLGQAKAEYAESVKGNPKNLLQFQRKDCILPPDN